MTDTARSTIFAIMREVADEGIPHPYNTYLRAAYRILRRRLQALTVISKYPKILGKLEQT